MTSSSPAHASAGPGWAWLGGTAGAVIGTTQIQIGRGSIIAATILILLIAGTLWASFGSFSKSWIPRTLRVVAGVAASAWLVIVLASLSSGVDEQRTETIATPVASPPPKSPTVTSPTKSATADPPASESSVPPSDLPSPRTGASAPAGQIREGQSADFYRGAVRVGVSSIFSSFAAMNAETTNDTCDSANPNVGQSFVVADGDHYSHEPAAWFRIVLLGIQKRTVTVRVERVISTGEPNHSSYLC